MRPATTESTIHPTRPPPLRPCGVAPTWYAQVVQPVTMMLDAASFAQLKLASQERLKRELGAFIQELSRDQPLLLFLDDLHWAEYRRSTIGILEQSAGFVAGADVTTYRAVRDGAREASISSDQAGFAVTWPLPRTSAGVPESSGDSGVSRAAFPGHRFPAEFPSLIHAKTEGSPLFMADLVATSAIAV